MSFCVVGTKLFCVLSFQFNDAVKLKLLLYLCQPQKKLICPN